MQGTDLFDASYFNLGTAEAKTTDPQQRLLLTATYDALRSDGYDKGLLQNNPLGVFTALSNNEWFQVVVPEAGVYTGPGVSSAIAANRISTWACRVWTAVPGGLLKALRPEPPHLW